MFLCVCITHQRLAHQLRREQDQALRNKNKGSAGGEVGHRSFSLEAQRCPRGRLGCGGNSPAHAQEGRHVSKPSVPEAMEVRIKETTVKQRFLSLSLSCMHFL